MAKNIIIATSWSRQQWSPYIHRPEGESGLNQENCSSSSRKGRSYGCNEATKPCDLIGKELEWETKLKTITLFFSTALITCHYHPSRKLEDIEVYWQSVWVNPSGHRAAERRAKSGSQVVRAGYLGQSLEWLWHSFLKVHIGLFSI